MTEVLRDKVHSVDGTTICYEVRGDGVPLIFVEGATSYRAMNPAAAESAELLSDEFAVVTYDRRGRGESSEMLPYRVEREIEDLDALIAVFGTPAVICGQSSGAVLALDATEGGLPVSRLALFEPPFVVGNSRPPLPADYVQQLELSIDEDRRGDAVELFLTAAAALPVELVGKLRQTPFWPALEEAAHTIAYDGRLMAGTMSGEALPKDRWPQVTVPALVLYGEGTEPWLVTAARAVGELLPTATVRPVTGQQHSFDPKALATALREFCRTD
ncbi:alpha/beta hydrolase [Streptomyces sp. SID13031]|uniref:alpha/beta fold hydrolase n=1 Tax=Streptomyces sp. SID13031 TaxID=2706046 RepID=UPI0013C642F9|nr:alpha/beta hydrolase [Streptomyces sp. SID13031]NEA34329.1 alpha/beta hydrolase [Streptomyces sp. SID13031]